MYISQVTLVVILVTDFLGNFSVKGKLNETKPATEVLKQFIVKFYQRRFLEGQNVAIAPLLTFYDLLALTRIADPSAEIDFHSFAGVSQNANELTWDELEQACEHYLHQAVTARSRLVSRLYVDRSIGKTNTELLGNPYLTTIRTNFSDERRFLTDVNSWVKSEFLRGQEDLLQANDVRSDTRAFLVGALSFDWPSQLATTTEERDFQGDKIRFLERNLRTLYVNLTEMRIDVLELKSGDLSRIKLWLILPHPQSSVREFSDALTVDTISVIEQGLLKSMADVGISIPQVAVEYGSQEDLYVSKSFAEVAPIFETPSLRLVEGKEDLYSLDSYRVKCVLQLRESKGIHKSKVKRMKHFMTFNRPFVMMMLTKEESVPLVIVNYFSTKSHGLFARSSSVDSENSLDRLHRLLPTIA